MTWRVVELNGTARVVVTSGTVRTVQMAEDVHAAWDRLEVPARRAVIRALMGVSVTRVADRTRAARTDPARVLIVWKA